MRWGVIQPGHHWSPVWHQATTCINADLLSLAPQEQTSVKFEYINKTFILQDICKCILPNAFSLVQSLPVPMLTCFQWDQEEQRSIKFDLIDKNSMKDICKCLFANAQFILASEREMTRTSSNCVSLFPGSTMFLGGLWRQTQVTGLDSREHRGGRSLGQRTQTSGTQTGPGWPHHATGNVSLHTGICLTLFVADHVFSYYSLKEWYKIQIHI